jgi:hypothetical protein
VLADGRGLAVRVVRGGVALVYLFTFFSHGHRTTAIVVLVVSLVVGVGAEAGARFSRRWWLKRAQAWPITQAHVESGKVLQLEGEIAYSYFVNGEYHSGFHKRQFKSEEEAFAFVDALKGKTVLVNYDPGNHGVSVLMDSALRSAVPDPSVLRERRWC